MMKNRYPALEVVALVTLFLAATIVYAGEKKFEKKFSVSPGGTLTLKTDVGSVTVTGTSSNEVRVIAEMKGSEHDLKKFEVSADQVNTGVEVVGHGPKGGIWPWDWSDVDARFQIEVPRNYNMNVETSGGDVSVSSVKGTIVGKTSGGNISAGDVEGTVRMGTSGGDVRGSRVKGELSLETSGGNVRIDSVTGNVNANTSGGSISVSNVDGKVHVETSGGNVAVKLSGGNKGIDARTSGGDIVISVPKDVGAMIDASTSGGDVVCDLPVTTSGKMDESRLRGSVNGGGEMILARTSGGNVRIRANE